MKKSTYQSSNKTINFKNWLFLLLITLIFFPLGVRAQQALTCEFTNSNSPNVIPCGSSITATINFTSQVEVIKLTFPNSFEISAPLGVGVGTANTIAFPLGSTIYGIPVSTDFLWTKILTPIAGTTQMQITLNYRNCNLYNASAVNTSALFFDCDGGPFTTPDQFAAEITTQGLIPYGTEIAKATHTLTPPPIQISAGAFVQNIGNSGTPYSRIFNVVLNSLSIDNFDLNIPIESDVDGVSLELISGSITPLPLYVNGIGNHNILLSDYPSNITYSGNTRILTFRQNVILSCGPIGTAIVEAKINCGSCTNQSVSTLELDGTVGTNINILLQNNITPPTIFLFNDPSIDPGCSGTYYYDLSFRFSGYAVNLTSISIPINTKSYTVQDVSIGNPSSLVALGNTNFTISTPASAFDPDDRLINIPVQTIYSSTGPWPGFSSNLNGVNGAWILPTQIIKLRIKLDYECPAATLCTDLPIQLSSYTDNQIVFEMLNSCTTSINQSVSLIQIASANFVQTNVSPYVNNPQPQAGATVLFGYDIGIPSESPFQINAGLSNEQVDCPHPSFRAVFSTNSLGAKTDEIDHLRPI